MAKQNNNEIHRGFSYYLSVVLNPTLSSARLTAIVVLFLVICDNVSFWRELLKIFHKAYEGNALFFCSTGIVLPVLLYLFFSLFSVKYLLKPVFIFVLLTASFAAYFMDAYGVMISRDMIRNVMQTDSREAMELVSSRMFVTFAFLGVIPSILVYRTTVLYKTFLRETMIRVVTVLGCAALLLAILLPFYKEYISLGKNYKYVRHLINPVNYIYAISTYTKGHLSSGSMVIKKLGEDAALASTWQQRGRKNLVILVVGETARAKNFSLYDYQRDTNPALRQEDVFTFTDVHSCGTDTATSVPCMFSPFDRSSFSVAKADHSENLLDVLSHAGVNVLWRDNNSGCKGACERVAFEDLSNMHLDDLCTEDECYDMVLLQNLQKIVALATADTFIVLHQKGSHGPSYYLRYPGEFEKFTPVCKTNELQQCRPEEVINAYDNTILYTDYFLSQVIAFLKNNTEQFNTSMLYISDHGESLSENNLYLHGLPYFIAPEEQTHVPFILWVSPETVETANIDQQCLQEETTRAWSHDNLFHSVLGLMDIRSAVYKKSMDIFSGCR